MDPNRKGAITCLEVTAQDRQDKDPARAEVWVAEAAADAAEAWGPQGTACVRVAERPLNTGVARPAGTCNAPNAVPL